MHISSLYSPAWLVLLFFHVAQNTLGTVDAADQADVAHGEERQEKQMMQAGWWYEEIWGNSKHLGNTGAGLLHLVVEQLEILEQLQRRRRLWR